MLEYRLNKTEFNRDFEQIESDLSQIRRRLLLNRGASRQKGKQYTILTEQLRKLSQNAAVACPCEDMLTPILLFLAEYAGSGEDIYNHEDMIGMLSCNSI